MTSPKKIGVVGLLPRQAGLIQTKYRGKLSLRFLPREGERANISAFSSNHDVVLLMTKFIGHSIFDSVPSAKRVLVAGGLTDLQRYLDEYVVTTSPVKAPIEPIEDVPMAAPHKKTDILTDLSLLQFAQVGDVFEIEQPTGTTNAKWRQSVSSVRSYRKRVNGIHTVVENLDETKIRITVVAPSEDDVSSGEVDAATATVWVNFANFRAMSGVPLKQVVDDADNFLTAFKKRFS